MSISTNTLSIKHSIARKKELPNIYILVVEPHLFQWKLKYFQLLNFSRHQTHNSHLCISLRGITNLVIIIHIYRNWFLKKNIDRNFILNKNIYKNFILIFLEDSELLMQSSGKDKKKDILQNYKINFKVNLSTNILHLPSSFKLIQFRTHMTFV